jgi:ABC-type nitrate/sulfonate/bicarbonate transport system permease component
MLNVLALAVFLLLWQMLAMWVASPFFPPVDGVFKAFKNLLVKGDTQGISLGTHAWASLYRVLLGFNLGVKGARSAAKSVALRRQIARGRSARRSRSRKNK